MLTDVLYFGIATGEDAKYAGTYEDTLTFTMTFTPGSN